MIPPSRPRFRIGFRWAGVVSPADLIGAAVFLAAPASDYLTGQTIVVDGGFLIA